jgi:hypothetical protein
MKSFSEGGEDVLKRTDGLIAGWQMSGGDLIPPEIA